MAYFLIAAECGNFSEAAQRLYVSQPQISKWIRGLEKDLGVILFRRTAHGVVLTDEGQYLYAEWHRIHEHFNKALETVKAMGAGYRGTLRIGNYRAFGESASMAAAVSRGLGFTLIGDYIAKGHEDTIKTFPLPEQAIPSWLVLAWRDKNAATARELAQFIP